MDEQQALEQLEALLAPRIAQAEHGEVYDGPTALNKLLAELNAQHREEEEEPSDADS